MSLVPRNAPGSSDDILQEVRRRLPDRGPRILSDLRSNVGKEAGTPHHQEQIAAILVCEFKPSCSQLVRKYLVQKHALIEASVVCTTVVVERSADPAELCSAVRTRHVAASIHPLYRQTAPRALPEERVP